MLVENSEKEWGEGEIKGQLYFFDVVKAFVSDIFL